MSDDYMQHVEIAGKKGEFESFVCLFTQVCLNNNKILLCIMHVVLT